MRGYLIFIFTLFFSSCSNSERELTLNELINAKWKPLFNGVDYISTEKTGKENSSRDSLTVKFKGMKANFTNGKDADLGQFKYGSNSIVADLLKNTLKESRTGYLRISLGALVNFSADPKIYLKNIDTGKYFFSLDSIGLLQIPGIKSVKFISKEEAKKVYLADGGEDWSHVLAENPLPDAIELKLEYTEWTKESLEKLKFEILQKITTASDFIYPAPYEEDKNIKVLYYYYYKRN
jgi:hypothetical protein